MATTPGFRYANQAYGALLADDVVEGGSLPYREGRLEVPTAPGIGVTLDSDRMARYAELYATSGGKFAFDDPGARQVTPELPKR